MATVSIKSAGVADTPSTQVVAKAAAEVIVKDARGRAITLRNPGVLAQFRLIEALGDTAKNDVYVGMVVPLIYVSEIDGERVVPFSTKRSIEVLVQRLEEDGLAAVMAGVSEHFAKPDPDATKEALKN